MTIKQLAKITNGKIASSNEKLDADLLEISQESGNNLIIKEDGLYLNIPSSSGGGGAQAPEGQQFITSSNGKVLRSNIGSDVKEILNIHTQVGLKNNLVTTTGSITYDGKGLSNTIGTSGVVGGVFSCYLLENSSLTFTVPQGTKGNLGIGLWGSSVVNNFAFSDLYPAFNSINLNELTSDTVFNITCDNANIITINAQNLSGSVLSGYPKTVDYNPMKPFMVGTYGLEYCSVSFLLTNNSSVTVDLGNYELITYKDIPYLVFVEQIQPIINNISNSANCLVYGVGAIASGAYSTVLGDKARANSIGSIAIGNSTEVTGTLGLCLGYRSTTNGIRSITIGAESQSTSTECITIGSDSLSNSTGGVTVGSASKNYSANSTIIGYTATIPASCSNSTAIGYTATVTAQNQVQLGNSNTTTFTYGAVQNRSDIRDKVDIQDVDLGLDFINKLRPVKYKWDYREDYINDLFPTLDKENFNTEAEYTEALEQQIINKNTFYSEPLKDGSKTRQRYHYGLIAQEFKEVLDDLNADHAAYQDHSLNGGLDIKSLGYMELIPNLIKAIQELSEENKELKQRIEVLEK